MNGHKQRYKKKPIRSIPVQEIKQKRPFIISVYALTRHHRIYTFSLNRTFLLLSLTKNLFSERE